MKTKYDYACNVIRLLLENHIQLPWITVENLLGDSALESSMGCSAILEALDRHWINVDSEKQIFIRDGGIAEQPIYERERLAAYILKNWLLLVDNDFCGGDISIPLSIVWKLYGDICDNSSYKNLADAVFLSSIYYMTSLNEEQKSRLKRILGNRQAVSFGRITYTSGRDFLLVDDTLLKMKGIKAYTFVPSVQRHCDNAPVKVQEEILLNIIDKTASAALRKSGESSGKIKIIELDN